MPKCFEFAGGFSKGGMMGKGHYYGANTRIYAGAWGNSEDPVPIERVRALEAQEKAKKQESKAKCTVPVVRRKRRKQSSKRANLELVRSTYQKSKLLGRIEKEQRTLEFQQRIKAQYENEKKVSKKLMSACCFEIQATIERIKKLQAKYDAMK